MRVGERLAAVAILNRPAIGVHFFDKEAVFVVPVARLEQGLHARDGQVLESLDHVPL